MARGVTTTSITPAAPAPPCQHHSLAPWHNSLAPWHNPPPPWHHHCHHPGTTTNPATSASTNHHRHWHHPGCTHHPGDELLEEPLCLRLRHPNIRLCPGATPREDDNKGPSRPVLGRPAGRAGVTGSIRTHQCGRRARRHCSTPGRGTGWPPRAGARRSGRRSRG